jgi:hypothetical protein
MAQLREVILSSLAGLLALACVFAIYCFLVPPFTDREIQQSFVDTWQVNAIVTSVALSIVVPAGVLSALLSWRGTRLAKRLGLVSVSLSAVTVALLVLSHAALTERATRLTGQEFGGILGLGLGPL